MAHPAWLAASPCLARRLPNVLVAGTPGTGKSSLCEMVASTTPLKHYCLGAMAKERGYHAGRDEVHDTLILDEASMDKLCDDLEGPMGAGGVLLEHHSVDYFPERWFDLVLVLRTDNTALFDRLTKRGYSTLKVGENVEAEIMQVVLEEALESYAEGAVHELASNSVEDMEANAARVNAWLATWLADHGVGGSGAAGFAGAQ